MKKYIILLILFISSLGYSQIKDTIFLEQVIVENNIKIKKIKTVYTTGKKCGTFSTLFSSKIVSLIKDIPNQKLKSVVFKFNKRKSKKFKTTSFRLIIKDMNLGIPYNNLIDEMSFFKINPDFSGKYEIDVSHLNIINLPNEIFVGLELISDDENLNFSLDCKCDDNGRILSLINNNTNWISTDKINLDIQLIFEK